MKRSSTARRRTLAALLAALLGLGATSAFAGECPADKRVADGQGQKNPGHAAKGVTDVVRSSIDLASEAPNLPNRLFRARQLDIEPGGIVPWHSHGERPAQIYVVKGEIVEYASNCAVPIVHKTGDIAREARGTSHWWQNHGKSPVVLISVDIFHDTTGADRKTM
jgi:quercetin dioxygenase-like cupin family protein